MTAEYPRRIELHIAGRWRPSQQDKWLPVENPANEETLGMLACAGQADLEEAVEAADKAFQIWRNSGVMERYGVLREAARLLRERCDSLAILMTLEQGKPLREARTEIGVAADVLDWFAEEPRRVCGRIIPARASNVDQHVFMEPVGPVAAFTPWNFPINQMVRKLAVAVAAGCSVVVKGPEDTPASCAGLIQAFHDAGLPDGVINLVFGVPSEISNFLIPHPLIRKVSFTGSTEVGKQLASLAGKHMKRVTMELGGHAPALVFADCDVKRAATILAAAKYRNAGQVCVSPSRILVEESACDTFVASFTAHAEAITVGQGVDEKSGMGPVIHARRLLAAQSLVEDAVQHGANCVSGGRRIGNKGHFFAPTVLSDVPASARIMNEEPFAPVASISTFADAKAAVEEANRLDYGLAAYLFCGSERGGNRVAKDIRAGMVTINHIGFSHPELPFGGIKDSGMGTEGGTGAIDAYLNEKLITQLHE